MGGDPVIFSAIWAFGGLFWVYPLFDCHFGFTPQVDNKPKHQKMLIISPWINPKKIAFKYIGPIKILLVKSTVFKQKVAFFLIRHWWNPGIGPQDLFDVPALWWHQKVWTNMNHSYSMKKKTENMVRLWMGQRNPASWLLVYLSAGKHPILYRVFYYSRWFRISQPSTVSCHCPSFFTSLYSLRIGGILIPQKNWGVNDSNPQHPNENPNDLNRYSPGKITPSVAQELLLHHQQIDVRLR